VTALSGLAQLIAPLIVSGIAGAGGVSVFEEGVEGAAGAGAAGAGTSRVTAGVFTGGGGASPRVSCLFSQKYASNEMPINKEWIKSAKKSDLAADNYGML
jgi:hypothetical protein